MSGVKRVRTKDRIGSSSQDQEVTNPTMTLERRMKYLRGRPMAKEHRAPRCSWRCEAAVLILGRRHCRFLALLPAVPLTDEQRTSEQDLWTLMTGKTSAVVGSIIKQRAVDKLTKEVQELRDDQEKLRTAFEGECTVTFLRNKAVVAHMKGSTNSWKKSRRLWMISRQRQIHRRFPEIFQMTWRLSVMLFSLDIFMMFLLSF
ncbi:hypothetical protein CJ030_MR7G028006 [Morella rubra]|uniref:Uncharacterized protein n=1 Tax=Morella rubra TaxID=262757 RepID=A0A6A1UZJ7_9ROSI|nr:hypothetical protein CJ030_MR7G028006 [Morella rubra]